MAPGDVRRLSVAVLLDVPLVNGVRTPRPDEEVERIRRLVASAAGIRADRKDELEIAQVSFDPGVAAPGEAPAAREGARPRQIPWTWVAGLVAALLLFAALIFSSEYRLQRVMGFMDPWSDPYGKGYQLSHALIAFGRGEWLGVGLGGSVEKLFYLPEAHTDFLLAVIAEELGLIEPLGTWVMQQACRTFAEWQRRFGMSGLECITVGAREIGEQGRKPGAVGGDGGF